MIKTSNKNIFRLNIRERIPIKQFRLNIWENFPIKNKFRLNI